MNLDKAILKLLIRKKIKIPLYNSKTLNYLRELDEQGLDNHLLIKMYYSKKLSHMALCIIIALAFIIFLRDRGRVIYMIVMVLLVIPFIALDRDIKMKIEDRRNHIMMDFPSFINKVILLIDSGVSLTRAWGLACEDNNSSPLYKEARRVKKRMENGCSFNHALEEFAMQCRVPEVSKFTSLLLQNYKKGGDDLKQSLRIQGTEIWQMRKNVIFRIASRGNTKLLFPMMLIFIGIMILIMTPALLRFKGF